MQISGISRDIVAGNDYVKCLHSHIRLSALIEGVNVVRGGAQEVMSNEKMIQLKFFIRFQHSNDLIHEAITITPMYLQQIFINSCFTYKMLVKCE